MSLNTFFVEINAQIKNVQQKERNEPWENCFSPALSEPFGLFYFCLLVAVSHDLLSSTVSLSSSLPPLPPLTVFHFSLSLSLWQTEGWWVCCRSNSFIQPLSVGSRSIARWRHTNTTVFPRRNDLVVSVRKQNEARQHEHPSLRPSILPSSLRLSAMLAGMLITHSGRKDNRRVKTNESSLTIMVLPSSRFSSRSGCFSSQMFVVSSRWDETFSIAAGRRRKWPDAHGGDEMRKRRDVACWKGKAAQTQRDNGDGLSDS